eukprot:CAMPEP_0114246322 /NCGR_PEP_ID=MMETSP0058-20121206/12394_1 /TAXON_ID=36894 /ORGANISM="Pyramimonas parkeae, CCMP726" /LENGTH=471 /DNA_ID=CAMNT_0001359487 /DNA_START=205 /DNA_END=1623 /DNA_ORIENTATION=+
MPVKKSGNGMGPANKRMKGKTIPEVAVPQEATRGKMQDMGMPGRRMPGMGMQGRMMPGMGMQGRMMPGMGMQGRMMPGMGMQGRMMRGMGMQGRMMHVMGMQRKRMHDMAMRMKMMHGMRTQARMMSGMGMLGVGMPNVTMNAANMWPQNYQAGGLGTRGIVKFPSSDSETVDVQLQVCSPSDGAEEHVKVNLSATRGTKRPRQSDGVFLENTTHEEECPSWLVGRIIGRGGQNIRNIQGATGTVLQVGKEVAGSKVRRITVKGDSVRVARAASVLQHQIRTLEAEMQSGEDADDGSGAEQVVNCPKQRVAVVIGRGGATIKALQVLSDARVQVKKDEAAESHTPISVTGHEDAVATAVEAITALIDLELQEAYAYAEQIVASAAERLAWDQQQNSQQDTADPAEEEAALESDNEIQDQDEEIFAADDLSSTGGWIQRMATHPDGTTKIAFYVNKWTGQTQWIRPAQMGWT